ncbi:MAG TPA: alanine--glyoxylate aminotransferase family protein [Candidatus Baltobacteraceae bacterium]|jgi:aspartate aminotransferase-like enzyme|nr:alanine--glyoxylate aminotransferase family protein [Candidatus Baltobacteraceae bacterium]
MSRQLLFIPGPVTVSKEVLAAMATPLINHRGPEFSKLLTSVTEKLRPIFGTAGEIVLLGSSGTGALESAVTSSFSPGQKILACPVGVFGKRLAAIARTWGLKVETIDTEAGAIVDPQVLAARLTADRAHEIAGVLLTHNETSTGVQHDMAAIARAIGDHPATTIVDSVSGLGAVEFRTDDWRFDIVVTAVQKALGAPPGIAMLAVSQRAWERIAGATGPRFYFDLLRARKFASDGQTPWTPPVSLIFALDTALDQYHAEGARNVWARHARNAYAIQAFAEGANLAVFSKPGAHSMTVVALHVPAGIVAGDILTELRERHGLIFGGGQDELKGKIFRVGTMGAITPQEVFHALETFETVLIAHGHQAKKGAGTAAAREILEGVIATR